GGLSRPGLRRRPFPCSTRSAALPGGQGGPIEGVAMRIRTLLPTLCLLAAACGDGTGGGDGTTDRCTITLAPSSNDQETVQTAFVEAASGSTICFEEGIYRFSDELSITVPGITVRGVGDAVVFDFADQEAGANGLHVSGDDFTIENLAIRNTKG